MAKEMKKWDKSRSISKMKWKPRCGQRRKHRLLSKSPREIGIPAVALYELEVGIAKSGSPERRRTQLQEFAASVNILTFSEHEARTAAKIRADLERQGISIGPYALLIAGTALAHNATLITHNTREFERVDKLQLEDWY